jgi:hypothetical protein
VAGFAAWTQHRSSSAEIERWSRERDYGICVQTRRVRAIDVDVADEEQAKRIPAFLVQRWGFDLPWRSRPNVLQVPAGLRDGGRASPSASSSASTASWSGWRAASSSSRWARTPRARATSGTAACPTTSPSSRPKQFEQVWADLVATFAIEEAATSSASVKGHKLAEVIASDAVAQFLLNTSRVKRTERDGRMHIACPFEEEHTADSGDSATTYFPAHTGGYINGHFQCLHAHCEHRADQEFLDAIDYANPELASEFAAIGDAGAALVGDVGDRASPADRTGAAERGAVAAAVAPPARFTFQPAHEFAVGTPAAWMVKGVLPAAQLAVMFGESGSGKSFAALDLAVAVATGTPWRDRRVREGKVAYIAAEGAGGFRARLKAIAQHRQLELERIALTVLADAPNFMEKQDALDVARAIVAAGGAQLVIVDTFAQVMPGANENAGEDVGRALAHCKGIHRATGALVLLVHHSGKDASRGARGWSGLRAAADVELEVVRVEHERSLTVTKMKDGDDGMEFAFRLDSLVVGLDADGEEVSSCVVQHGEGQCAGQAQRGRRGQGRH